MAMRMKMSPERRWRHGTKLHVDWFVARHSSHLSRYLYVVGLDTELNHVKLVVLLGEFGGFATSEECFMG